MKKNPTSKSDKTKHKLLAKRLCKAVADLKWACIELTEVFGNSCRGAYDDEWQQNIVELLEGHPSHIDAESEAKIVEVIQEELDEIEERERLENMRKQLKQMGFTKEMLFPENTHAS